MHFRRRRESHGHKFHCCVIISRYWPQPCPQFSPSLSNLVALASDIPLICSNCRRGLQNEVSHPKSHALLLFLRVSNCLNRVVSAFNHQFDISVGQTCDALVEDEFLFSQNKMKQPTTSCVIGSGAPGPPAISSYSSWGVVSVVST